jgi:hypothetical protein
MSIAFQSDKESGWRESRSLARESSRPRERGCRNCTQNTPTPVRCGRHYVRGNLMICANGMEEERNDKWNEQQAPLQAQQ